MDRRGFLLAASAAACPVAAGAAPSLLPVPLGGRMAFQVLRNGSPIGEHHLAFAAAGDALTITTSVGLLVTVAAIPIFRYGLEGVERWQGGVFQSFDSVVNFNGNPLQVHARRAAGGYEVEGINHDQPVKSTGRYLAPPNLMPLTYWNERMMYGTVLNIQTGRSYPVKVASPGWNKLPTVDGGSITAQRFNLSGRLTVSVWYDRLNAWSGLEFQRSGDISYRKMPA